MLPIPCQGGLLCARTPGSSPEVFANSASTKQTLEELDAHSAPEDWAARSGGARQAYPLRQSSSRSHVAGQKVRSARGAVGSLPSGSHGGSRSSPKPIQTELSRQPTGSPRE